MDCEFEFTLENLSREEANEIVSQLQGMCGELCIVPQKDATLTFDYRFPTFGDSSLRLRYDLQYEGWLTRKWDRAVIEQGGIHMRFAREREEFLFQPLGILNILVPPNMENDEPQYGLRHFRRTTWVLNLPGKGKVKLEHRVFPKPVPPFMEIESNNPEALLHVVSMLGIDPGRISARRSKEIITAAGANPKQLLFARQDDLS